MRCGVGEAEFYASVLPEPVRGPCQHITCDSWNEINMMYHAWAFQGSELGEDQSTEVEMSLYDAHGVRETHQSLGVLGRGIHFEELSARTVTLHGYRFSPCNAQVEMLPDVNEYCFFALGFHKLSKRAVVSYHVISANSATEKNFAQTSKNSKTLNEWISTFRTFHQGALTDILMANLP
eukprot:TRINITY_DN7291_c0_g1_i1.p1 TRINITY_DN7291_c0_g1~~TRINITY_DN7291_c0_g1_i1.p1  ORF type:complete len:179 (-),score=36.40 TRINITY_DN7291_c0_g1_i1:123-659(-)